MKRNSESRTARGRQISARRSNGGGSCGRIRASGAIVLLLLVGCTAGPSPFTAQGSPDPEIEVIVRNQRFSAVTAFVEWDGRNARRIGEVPGRDSERFVIPTRGQEMRIVFQSMGRAPDARVADREREAIGSNVEPASIRPGDRFEWTFRNDGYVSYIRLPPMTSDADLRIAPGRGR